MQGSSRTRRSLGRGAIIAQLLVKRLTAQEGLYTDVCQFAWIAGPRPPTRVWPTSHRENWYACNPQVPYSCPTLYENLNIFFAKNCNCGEARSFIQKLLRWIDSETIFLHVLKNTFYTISYKLIYIKSKVERTLIKIVRYKS